MSSMGADQERYLSHTAARLRQQVARHGLDYETAGPVDAIVVAVEDDGTIGVADDASQMTLTQDQAEWLIDRLADLEYGDGPAETWENFWALAQDAERI